MRFPIPIERNARLKRDSRGGCVFVTVTVPDAVVSSRTGSLSLVDVARGVERDGAFADARDVARAAGATAATGAVTLVGVPGNAGVLEFSATRGAAAGSGAFVGMDPAVPARAGISGSRAGVSVFVESRGALTAPLLTGTPVTTPVGALVREFARACATVAELVASMPPDVPEALAMGALTVATEAAEDEVAAISLAVTEVVDGALAPVGLAGPRTRPSYPCLAAITAAASVAAEVGDAGASPRVEAVAEGAAATVASATGAFVFDVVAQPKAATLNVNAAASCELLRISVSPGLNNEDFESSSAAPLKSAMTRARDVPVQSRYMHCYPAAGGQLAYET